MQCFRRSLSAYSFFLQCIGKVGKIKKIDDDGDVHISYAGLLSVVFHPDAVIKVCTVYMYVCGIVLHGGMCR